MIDLSHDLVSISYIENNYIFYISMTCFDNSKCWTCSNSIGYLFSLFLFTICTTRSWHWSLIFPKRLSGSLIQPLMTNFLSLPSSCNTSAFVTVPWELGNYTQSVLYYFINKCYMLHYVSFISVFSVSGLYSWSPKSKSLEIRYYKCTEKW